MRSARNKAESCKQADAESARSSYRYVEAIFASDFVWSRLDKIRWRTRNGTCVGDGPYCNVCAHSSYCSNNGLGDLQNVGHRWLRQYPDFYDELAIGCSELGGLPRGAGQAVVLALQHQNAIFWQAPVAVPRAKQLSIVRASLTDISVHALREVLRRPTSSVYQAMKRWRRVRRKCGRSANWSGDGFHVCSTALRG